MCQDPAELARDINKELYVDYEDNPMRHILHESQNSDEINKVVNDFHIRRQRMVYDSFDNSSES